jgi:predicted nucleic acid-binding protein
MKLLLDTNIVVDIISKREGYRESLQILKYCELKQVLGFVSVITVNDVIYILRKHAPPATLRDAVQTLLVIVDVADVLRGDINRAFASDMTDYEDALQAECAKRISADYIVTRNLPDFKQSPVSAITPENMLKLLKKTGRSQS